MRRATNAINNDLILITAFNAKLLTVGKALNCSEKRLFNIVILILNKTLFNLSSDTVSSNFAYVIAADATCVS